MPRYFFNHLAADGQRDIDIDGMHLPSLHAALEEAATAAEGAMSIASSPVQGCFEVEDEGRVVIARVPYRNSPPEA